MNKDWLYIQFAASVSCLREDVQAVIFVDGTEIGPRLPCSQSCKDRHGRGSFIKLHSQREGTHQTSWDPNTWSYLKVVSLIIVHIESSKKLRVAENHQHFGICDTIWNCLPGKFLHLDIIKLTKVAEPLDHLGGNAAVELYKQQGPWSQTFAMRCLESELSASSSAQGLTRMASTNTKKGFL